MVVQSATLLFSGESLVSLASCVGRRWLRIGGVPLSERPGHLFSWDSVTIQLHGARMQVRTSLVPLQFEGYEEAYSALDFGSEVGSSRRRDTIRRNRGEIGLEDFQADAIVDVLVIRESVSRRSTDGLDWDFSTDYGVIFALESGAIGVTKSGHHSEALDVVFGRDVETLDTDQSSDEWTSDVDPGESYVVRRETIPVHELL